ncbi:seven transmembrane MLO family protein [Actinidia rufa]|uniref:Seven transmembrane MLO family protein n=1 Tax=Actinidia rufa TaxID=165716 RepID=A0A7J0DK82_9ERIC|nr:seven transmembrane MLO family protein [Actinidia rufa]
MTGGKEERTLEETSTWAVAVVCFVMVGVSIVIEHLIHLVGSILLAVGAKLQMIITKMGLRIQERGDVVKGAPVVQPGDDLFWCNRPRLILFLIHFVLFTNAFQLAFFMWSWGHHTSFVQLCDTPSLCLGDTG